MIFSVNYDKYARHYCISRGFIYISFLKPPYLPLISILSSAIENFSDRRRCVSYSLIEGRDKNIGGCGGPNAIAVQCVDKTICAMPLVNKELYRRHQQCGYSVDLTFRAVLTYTKNTNDKQIIKTSKFFIRICFRSLARATCCHEHSKCQPASNSSRTSGEFAHLVFFDHA